TEVQGQAVVNFGADRHEAHTPDLCDVCVIEALVLQQFTATVLKPVDVNRVVYVVVDVQLIAADLKLEDADIGHVARAQVVEWGAIVQIRHATGAKKQQVPCSGSGHRWRKRKKDNADQQADRRCQMQGL
ncbi:MAG TPA: hypothetical protein PKD61_37875, partial [Polyangiaceae bacterium]|nr:hypothetical protein [Polyangiaceae bacterium]